MVVDRLAITGILQGGRGGANEVVHAAVERLMQIRGRALRCNLDPRCIDNREKLGPALYNAIAHGYQENGALAQGRGLADYREYYAMPINEYSHAFGGSNAEMEFSDRRCSAAADTPGPSVVGANAPAAKIRYATVLTYRALRLPRSHVHPKPTLEPKHHQLYYSHGNV